MSKKLRNLSINEISLVDKGANQHAHVSFFKRKGQDDMNPAELAKKLEATEKENAILKAVSELNDHEKAFYKGLSDSDKESFLKLEADARIAKMGDKVVKMVAASEVETVTKALNDATAELETVKKADADKGVEIVKLKGQVEDAELLAEVSKKYPHSKGTPVEKAATLKAVRAMTDETAKANVLKSMDDAEAAAAGFAKEKGATGTGDGKEATEKLNDLAKQIQTEATAKGEIITAEQAFVKALDTDVGKKLNEEIRAAK